MSRRKVVVALELEVETSTGIEVSTDELVEAVACEVPWHDTGMVHVKVGAYATVEGVAVSEEP